MSKSVNEITLEEMLSEVERELSVRRPFYRKQVEFRRMSQQHADIQLNRMEAVANLLRRMVKEKGQQTKLF